MLILLHGEAGSWDELIIAAVAFAVLWVAVKLAGRKPADEDETGEEAAPETSDTEEQPAARP